jgi:hypothetical protein
MDLDRTLDFLSRNSHLINKRFQQLQSKEAKVSPECKQSLVARHDSLTPQIRIIPSNQHTSWAEAFAGYSYTGFSRDTNEEGSLSWNVYPGADEKKDSDVDMYRQILYEVNGDIDTLDALGISLPSKREVKQRAQDDGNATFSVNIPERLFEDEMDYPEDHGMCGKGFYTGKN